MILVILNSIYLDKTILFYVNIIHIYVYTGIPNLKIILTYLLNKINRLP